MKKLGRRLMLKHSINSSIGLLFPFELKTENEEGSKDALGYCLPQRKLGKTGKKITILGLGGNHLAPLSEAESQKVIENAIEGGIRFFETAVSYGDGKSEVRYGKFLTPKYRDHIFLASKTHAKNAKEAQKHLETTLKRLKTDYIDLWQVHGVSQPIDVMERYYGGVLDVLLKAKEEGKVLHIGFTGHKSYLAHKTVLLKNKGLETCQMPINVADIYYKSFIMNIMPKLIKQNYGILAMKTLACGGLMGGQAYGKIPYGTKPGVIPNQISVKQALYFTWSFPITSIVLGYDNADMVKQNVLHAKNFSKITKEERKDILSKVAEIAKTGSMEWYKR